MRNDRIVPGVILICLGAIFLLHSFGYLHIHWFNIWRLWPIFIVIAGVNLIFAHNRSPWATAIKVIVVLGGVSILLFANVDSRFGFWPRKFYYYHHNDRDDDDDDNVSDSGDDDDDKNDNGNKIVRIYGSSTFAAPYDDKVHIAKLSINGGTTAYHLSDTTNQLFEAYTHEKTVKYAFDHHAEDSVYVLNFSQKDTRHLHLGTHDGNSVTFKLNTAPVWDIDMETGANSTDFDLSKYKVRSLKVSGGMASYDLKLGYPLNTTNVEISTGMASVTISIPKGAACRIDTDSGLSSNNFDGFNKTGDDKYETPGFAAAKQKMFINISGGVSDFKVRRY